MSEIYIPGEDNQKEQPPLLPNGTPMKRFEVITEPAKGGGLKNAVYIDGEYLDWSIDLNDLMEARKMGPIYYEMAKKDIVRHYCESVSEFIGRRVSIQEIENARKTGWI